MVRVAVNGASGKMGTTLCAAVNSAPDLSLVATIDPRTASTIDGVAHYSDATQLLRDECDVVIDFTVAEAARQVIPDLLGRSIPVVSGTTGITTADLDHFAAASASGNAPIVWTANFAIGAVLLMRFAAQAAPYFDAIEVIELHHDQKRDAPSGTAMATVSAMAAARGALEIAPQVDPTITVVSEGARGARAEGGIHVHSVRLPGLTAHEEVIFGAAGQTLTLRHDSYDRVSFVAGVLLAVRSIGRLDGLTIGIDTLFDLPTP